MNRLRRLQNGKALLQLGERARVISVGDLDMPAGVEFDDLGPSLREELMGRFQTPPPRREPQLTEADADEEMKRVRRKKLREIAGEITAVRDRGFAELDQFIPSKGLELA